MIHFQVHVTQEETVFYCYFTLFSNLEAVSSDESDTEEASKPIKGQHDFMVADEVIKCSG